MKRQNPWEKPWYENRRSMKNNPHTFHISLNHGNNGSSLEEVVNQSGNGGGGWLLRRSLTLAMPAIAALYVLTNVACNTQATPAPSPTNTPRPPATATAIATPVPMVNVISEQEFREGLEYLITIGSDFRATPETNRLINDVNGFLYYRLTGEDPNEDVVSVIVSEADMRTLSVVYYRPEDVEKYGVFGGFQISLPRSPAGTIRDALPPEVTQVFEKYAFPFDTSAKYATIVVGDSTTVVGGRRGIGILSTDNHERGHVRDFLYFNPYFPGEFGTPIPVERPGDYQSALIESIAKVFDVAATRLAQQLVPEVNLLAFADTEENRRHIDGMDKYEYLERMLPWLAVLGDPKLSDLAVELREKKMLSPQSLLRLQERLIHLRIPERKNYVYGLFSSPSYQDYVTEIKQIALSRLRTDLSPAQEAPFELRGAGFWLP